MSEELEKNVEQEKEGVVAEQPRQYTETEEKAMRWGWKPKDQWEGPEDEWRSAKDHLERGEMIGKIRALTGEQDSLRQALQHITEQNKKLYSSGYQKALDDLKAQRREALREGEFDKADELEEKIDNTKKQMETVERNAQPKVTRPDPEHLAWVQENPWYENPVMQKFADALAIEYVRVNNAQVTPAQVRDFVSKEIRKEFAHRFTSSERKVTGAPNPDGETRSGQSNTSKSTLDSRLAKAKAGMSDDERNIMKTLMKSAGMTEKEYLQMYVEADQR